jgi:PAS domain S-box-containing protein
MKQALLKIGIIQAKSNLVFILTVLSWTIIITVVVSLPSYLDASSKSYLMACGAIWFFGLPAIYFGLSRIHRRLLRLEEVENELTANRSRHTRAELVAGFGNWEFQMTTGEVKASTGARAIYGLTEDDITMAMAQSIPLPEYRSMLDQALEDLITGNQTYDFEFKIQRPTDGLIIDIHSVATYEPTTNTVLGVVQDISARKKAEESLLESERLFRSYIKYAPDGVFVADGKGKYIDVNDAASELTGYDRDELLRTNFIDLIASEDVEEAFIHFNRAAEAGYSSGDLQYVTKAGEKRWWKVNGVKLDENRFLGFVRDITERKKNEEALRESEEKYRRLVETICDWVWASDAEGCHTYSNPAVYKLLGYQITEVVGSSAFQFVHPDDEQPVREMVKNCIEQGVGWNNVAIARLHKDGSVRSFESSAIPILDTENHVTGFRGVDRDIVERKRLEAERLEIERKLLHAQKLESLAVMAGGIAHDFNNQLAVVLGNLKLALTNQDLDSATQKVIRSAVAAAKRSAELSRQMQIYTGNTLYHSAFLDLNELLEKNFSLLKLGGSNNVNLNLEINSTIPPIKGDADQIQSLVMNILVNSSEAIGDQDGDVTLRTGVMDCDEAYLRRSRLEEKPESGRFIFLEVTDTGCGMDADAQHKLFDPFFTTKFWGRGLGMPEVMGIVKGHRGAIMVDSDVGKGSSVRVLFPVSNKFRTPGVQTRAAVVTKAPMPESVARRKTVLVIEDEEQVREFCCEWLNLLGYDTIAAVDGAEGVHVFSERMNEIDIVLLDFIMPRMNGIEAFEELIRIKPEVKVILCSGYTEEEIGQRFLGRQPACILHKPYEMDTLKAELGRLLGSA